MTRNCRQVLTLGSQQKLELELTETTMIMCGATAIYAESAW